MSGVTRAVVRVVLLFFLIVVVKINAQDFSDNHVWSAWTLEKQISENVKPFVSKELRWGNDASQLWLDELIFGIKYTFNENIFARAIFKRSKERIGREWVDYDVPYANLVFKTKNEHISFKFRNQLELWTSDYEADWWRYRGRFKFATARPVFNLPVIPFVADELFYYFSSHKVKVNRIYAGLTYEIKNWLGIELAYCMQHKNKNNNWHSIHAIISGLEISY